MSTSFSDDKSKLAPKNHLNDLTGFEPLFYKFQVSPGWKEVALQPPPKWQLVDNTVAVIWELYSQGKNNETLGIEHLEWAREFLIQIQRESGENFTSMTKCMAKIEDRLIELYAHATFDIGPQLQMKAEKSVVSVDLKTPNIPMTQSAISELSKPSKLFTPPITVQVKSHKSSILKRPRRKESHKSMDIFARTAKQEDAEDSCSSEKKYETDVHNNSETSASQLTVTFNDILPPKNGSRTQESIQQLFESIDIKKNRCGDPKLYSPTLEELLEDTVGEALHATFRPYSSNSSSKISKEAIMNFLRQCRSDQVGKLQAELKRLSSIENLMRSIDEGGFQPYIEEDVSLKLSLITRQKELVG